MKQEKIKYVNDNIKKVSEVDLIAILKEHADKRRKQRREDAEALNEAIRSLFRCMPKQ